MDLSNPNILYAWKMARHVAHCPANKAIGCETKSGEVYHAKKKGEMDCRHFLGSCEVSCLLALGF